MYVCGHPIVFVCYLRVFVCISMLLAPAMWHMNASCRKQEWELRRCSTHQCLQKHGQILCDKTFVTTHLYVWPWHVSFICVTWLMHMSACSKTEVRVQLVSLICALCHTYGWVMSHRWMSRVAHVNESCDTCEWVLLHMCDMTHSYVWHDSLIYATRLIHMCDMIHPYVWHDSSMCVTRSYVCVVVHHWCMLQDSFTSVTWFIHMCDMTHPYVWHDSFIFVTWRFVCVVPH